MGGLEKEEVTGNISYDPANHQLMTDMRAWKIASIANDIPLVEVDGDDGAEVLVLGWGSTYGAIKAGDAPGSEARHPGRRGPPSPPQSFPGQPRRGAAAAYPKVLVPELNTGQLLTLIRAEFLVDAVGLNKVAGIPFQVTEIDEKIVEMVER